MKFVALLSILLCMTAFAKSDAPARPSCVKLYIALRHFLRLMSSGGEDSPANMFRSMTGIDPSDDMPIKRFSCRIAEVKTLEEAEALMLSGDISVDVMEALYAQLLSYIEEQGGMEVMGMAYEIVTYIMEAGELLDLKQVNFETVPIDGDPDVLNYMFENLVKKFGAEFVEGFFSNTVPFGDVPTLVAAVTESGSMEEAANDLQIEPMQLERFLANFGQMVTQEFLPLSFIKAAYFLLVTASEYGLLSLPIGH